MDEGGKDSFQESQSKDASAQDRDMATRTQPSLQTSESRHTLQYFSCDALF